MSRLRNFARDMEAVRSISAMLDKRLSGKRKLQNDIDGLSMEELQDVSKIVGLANFMLCKYEEKKTTKEILASFVLIINETCRSADKIDDEIAELLVAAEDSIGKIRSTHVNIADNSDLKGSASGLQRANSSANNFTNTVTEFNPLEYQ